MSLKSKEQLSSRVWQCVCVDGKIFEHLRPSILQEDSCASVVDPELQVTSALANSSEYTVRLGGNILHESFAPRYNSLILPWTYNYMSGGPEYAKFYEEELESRWRRHSDAAVLNPRDTAKILREELRCSSQVTGRRCPSLVIWPYDIKR